MFCWGILPQLFLKTILMAFFRLLSVIVALLCSTICIAQQADTVVVGQKAIRYSVEAATGSQYFWFVDGGTITSSNGKPEIFVDWGDKPGNYRVGVLQISASGCFSDTLWMNVHLTRTIFPTITAKTLVCPGETIVLAASAEDSIYKGIIYQWSTGESTREITATIYEKTRFSCVVYYNGDAVDTAFIDINVLPNFKPQITWSPLRPKQGEEVEFYFNDSRAANFFWTINGVVDSTSGNTLRTVFDTLGYNIVELTAFNALGCDQTTSQTLNIEGEKLFWVPNIFSPNDDGNYDVLIFDLPEGLRECTTTIYNRWGNIIFKSSDISHVEWDGKVNGEIVPKGTYVIDIVAYSMKNRYMQQSSVVNVIR